ncbi:uncharacterized protein B0H18DRAFT_1192173 [Fomitopsis serialis]|uniref:uncharacterized protein n=1 Tax=Fomitopsis serialis TaxID=139415 RepID=UPI0020086345|nr:uncharacterized protein B0H18DRAFT_1192173 [Neoantrodia serialis]KAH9920379.1 hypothetical protein B0H18DRAFT_1192173 [Neoantrodia serialis]
MTEVAEAPRDADISNYSVTLTGFVPSAKSRYARMNFEVLATIRPFIDFSTHATFLSVSTTSFSPEFRWFIFCFNWGQPITPDGGNAAQPDELETVHGGIILFSNECQFWNGLIARAAHYIQRYPEKFQGAKEAYLVRLVTTTSCVSTLIKERAQLASSGLGASLFSTHHGGAPGISCIESRWPLTLYPEPLRNEREDRSRPWCKATQDADAARPRIGKEKEHPYRCDGSVPRRVRVQVDGTPVNGEDFWHTVRISKSGNF